MNGAAVMMTDWISSMANLFLSGVVPRAQEGICHPASVLSLFGLEPVPGCWSGLYGGGSTREGLKLLLNDAKEPQVVFRVVCEVPGGIVTGMSASAAAEMGYLNIRYADAGLMHELRSAWVSESEDKDQAIHSSPHRVRSVLQSIGLNDLLLVLHPFQPKGGSGVLTAGTILSPSTISEVHSRRPGLDIRIA